MNKLYLSTVPLAFLAAAGAANAQNAGSNGDCTDYKPGTNFEQLSPGCQEVMNNWVTTQEGEDAAMDGEVTVGSKIPDSAKVMEVTDYKEYGMARINGKKVLVNLDTRTVVRVY